MSISEPSHGTGAYASSNYTQGELGKADCKRPAASKSETRNPKTETRMQTAVFGIRITFRASVLRPSDFPEVTALDAPKLQGIKQVPLSLRARLRCCAPG